MRHLVLGTAGHIDHGKSALVKALTGTDPDRLQEEKRRGITIDLGFADLDLDGERTVSFVDVPGHERFVRHMVAGATGIDAVLLVVAADHGVQPQTREHLQICSLLGLRHGLVALTKCDLVDRELREVVGLEVRELLEGTFLARAPLVEVSARSGDGLETLREELAELFGRVEPRSVTGVARLPIDRSFVLRGFGTVVTGTLVSGSLSDGDEIEVLPLGRRGRVRGLQVHRRSLRRAVAGQRSAVNLQGLSTEEAPRGSTITHPGALPSTRRIWAKVRLLEHAARALGRGGPVRFHQGTSEGGARLRVLGRDPDGTLQAEIYLEQETVLTPGDRFVLRRSAPVDTVGGGLVLDVRPPRPRHRTRVAFSVDAASDEEALLLRIERSGSEGCTIEQLAAEMGRTPQEVGKIVEGLADDARLTGAGPRWYRTELWRGLERATLRNLLRFHEAEPLRRGIAREELRLRVDRRLPQEVWRRMLEELATRGELRLEGDSVAEAGHRVVLDEESQALADRIDARFREAGLEPPEPAALTEQEPDRRRASQLVELLIDRNRLVRIQNGKLFHAEALDRLRRRLADYARESKRIDVASFKQLAGVTRKHAIPLLEYFDAIRVTRRIGNQREIL